MVISCYYLVMMWNLIQDLDVILTNAFQFANGTLIACLLRIT